MSFLWRQCGSVAGIQPALRWTTTFTTPLSSGEGSGLDNIFKHILPKLNEEESDNNANKYLVGAELIAFVKWLIYTAPFEDCNVKEHAKIHSKVYKVRRGTIRAAEKKMRRKLKAQLAIWYAKHPSGKK
jgi:hypothetical protein